MANLTIRQNKTTITAPHDAMVHIAMNYKLSKIELRVLVFLMARLDSTSYRPIDTKQIANALDIKKKEVKAALENLEYVEYIQRGGDVACSDGYKFII